MCFCLTVKSGKWIPRFFVFLTQILEKKMAIIDCVSWRPANSNIFAWHYPDSNLTTYTQLLVMESQEAVIFKEGQMIGKFGPGRHVLDTKNLPLLNTFYGIPFGGKNPFTAEIWFVNKLQPLDIGYQTSCFRYHDPDYKTMVPLFSRGRYGIKIKDSEKFLKKIVGTAEQFTDSDITNLFQGEIEIKLISLISSFMHSNTVGLKAISSYLEKISISIKKDLIPFWENYGFDLTAFYVISIDIDDSTDEGAEILRAMGQQSAQSIAGYTWQQEQSFRVAEKAMTSDSEFGIIGAMMMAGGGLFGGNSNSNLMRPVKSTAGAETKSHGQVGQETPVQMVFCSKCAKKYPSTSKFCPYCGDIYNPCPQCGSDNAKSVVRCVSCGHVLKEAASLVCSKCKTPLTEDIAFCPNCGTPASRKCPRCGTGVKSGLAFCPGCGKKLF